MPPPLAGLRVLDLSRQLPGPFCSTLLADLGADVLMVTAPGDPFAIGIPFLARNKRSMVLDLKAEAGGAVFRRLAARADVLLEGFRPGVTARLGVDYPTLRALNPRLVYCSISGYGQDGPYRDRVGHDVNYLGFAGVLDAVGTAGGPPAIPGVQIADIGGGALMAAAGILAALLAREHTGRGQMVDIAMMDGAFAWQVVNAMRYFAEGLAPARGDTLLTGRYPCYAVYETRDRRHVTVGALEPHFWRRLCEELGFPELVELQFAEGRQREDAFRKVRAKFRERTMAEWVARLADLDVCFGPVATLPEALADPQVRHREMVLEYDDGRGQRRQTLGNPLKLRDTPPTLRTPTPESGQHTDEVLRGLGYSAAEIAGLRAQGVV